MKKTTSKIIIIILIVLVLLAIGGGVFGYVYLCTDTFKSGQELFAKYLAQNLSDITQTTNIKRIDEINQKLKQNKYEENTTISYLKNEDETIGELKIDTQKDSIDKKTYMLFSLMLEGMDDSVEIEYINENDLYSIRFTEAIRKFLTIENANLKELATKLGIEENFVELIPDTINFEELPKKEIEFTDEEKELEIKKYLKILYDNIPAEKYVKEKEKVITVNRKTIQTNAYILTLNTNEIKDLKIKILEALQQDEIVLSKIIILEDRIREVIEEDQDFEEGTFKEYYIQEIQVLIDELNSKEIKEPQNNIITVYQENGNTVRIKAEQGLNYITLDTTQVEGKKQIDINCTSIDKDNTQLSNKITLLKENDNKTDIEYTHIEGEEQIGIKMSMQVSESDSNVKINATLKFNGNNQIVFNRNINFVDQINYKVTLSKSNNIVLNELTAEQISEDVFEKLQPILITEYVEPLEPVIEEIVLKNFYGMTNDSMLNGDMTDDGAEAFNKRFTNYEGENVSSNTVNSLLNMVLSHNIQESNFETERYVTVGGDVNLDSDATLPIRVEQDKYYTVKCLYEEGLVNEIIITENEEEPILEEREEPSLEEMSYNSNDITVEKITAINTPEEQEIVELRKNNELLYSEPGNMNGIANTGNKILGLVKTIGTIIIVYMLLF